MTSTQAPAIPAGGLVVFDFDHTLFRADSGTGLMVWMLLRNPLRVVVAVLVSVFIVPLFLWPSVRRIPISVYLWIATVGLRDQEFFEIADPRIRRPQCRRPARATAAAGARRIAGASRWRR